MNSILLLVGAALTTSFFDSLNPSAIAQQMVLQAMVKKKKHTWFFILGISLANVLLGLAVYYGIAAFLSQVWAQAAARYPAPVRILETGAGLACLLLGGRMLLRAHRSQPEETGEAKQPRYGLGPASLFLLGAAFCMVELTSALPYFGFLAFLSSYQLALPGVLAMILLYTLVYAAPLILLYFAYNRLRGTALIERLERVLGRVSAYILPAAVVLLGLLLGADGLSLLYP